MSTLDLQFPVETLSRAPSTLCRLFFFCEFALIYLNIWMILSLQMQLQSYLDIKPWWFKWFVFPTYWGGKLSMENLSMTHLYGFISNYDYGFIDTMWYHLRNHFPQLRTPMWVLTSAVGFVQMGWSILRELWEKTAVMMITYHHITLSIVSNHFLFSIFSIRIVSACFSHVSGMFQPCFMWPHALFAINGFNGSQVPRNTSCKRCGSLMRSGPGWIKMPGGTCWILCNLPQFLAASKIFEVNNTMMIIVMQL